MKTVCLLLAALGSASAFAMAPGTRAPARGTRVAAPPRALLAPDSVFALSTLLGEVVDESGERVYGAVDAPGWVLPVLAIAAISTSFLPSLLAPGEQALEQMRENEGNRFGDGKGMKRR